MTRLLHISPNQYPPLTTEHATKQIWKELSKGYEEYHIIARSNDQHFHTEQEGKLYLHRVPKLNGNKSFFFTSFFILHYINKYKIDVMLTQCGILGGIAGTFYGKLKKIPIMVEIHDEIYFQFLDKRRLTGTILRWVYRNAQRVRALNTYMEQMLKERGIKTNVVIIPNRANLTLFKPPKKNYEFQKEIIIISVGTFVPRKGHLLLIEVIKHLSKEYPIKLILAGGGELLDIYRQETQGLDNFIFYEQISQKELADLLKTADIYAHVSFREAVPRAIIEAMAMGIPIITSDAGMVKGLIQNEINGILFPVGDEKALEQGLCKLLTNVGLREKLGKAAYQDAQDNYEWNKNFAKYREVLAEMNAEYENR